MPHNFVLSLIMCWYDPIIQGEYLCGLKITPRGLLCKDLVHLALVLHGIYSTHELLAPLRHASRLHAHAMLEVDLNIGLLLIEHHPAARVQIPSLARRWPPGDLVSTRAQVVSSAMRAVVILNTQLGQL